MKNDLIELLVCITIIVGLVLLAAGAFWLFMAWANAPWQSFPGL